MKQGDPYDLNNWLGINLLDVVSNMISATLKMRSQKSLEINRHAMQVRDTPKVV